MSNRVRRRAAPPTIAHEITTFRDPHAGTVLAVVPVIPDDAPAGVREGIVRRRLVATTGHCHAAAHAHRYNPVRRAPPYGSAQRTSPAALL